MLNKEKIIEKASERFVSNEINDFIAELRKARANPIECFKILANKLDITDGKAFGIVRESPAWNHLFGVHNPFTQEYLDLASKTADEFEIKDGRVISVTIKLKEEE